MSDDDPCAVMGNVVKHRSMADGTIRLEVDLHTPDDRTYELAMTRIARVGSPLALARMSDEAAANEQAQGVQRQDAEERPDYGQWIATLYRQGTLKAPPVVRALGGDSLYQAWCRQQPCAVCGGYNYDPDTGIQQNEYGHVRRANNAGTAYKPGYSGVPLCHEHHYLQHNHGELAAYVETLGDPEAAKTATPAQAKEWFDREAAQHLERWAHEELRAVFGVDHLKEVSPQELLAWFAEHDLVAFLPQAFRDLEG